MDRETMARKLYEGAGSPQGYLQFDVAREFWRKLADAAIAECAKAARDAYCEGFADGRHGGRTEAESDRESDTRMKWDLT